MSTRACRRVRCRITMGAAALILPFSACHSPRPNPGAEDAIASAIGHGSAVVFRDEGSPLDEPEAAPGHLSLVGAVRLAISTSPALQASLARLRIAIADADQARLLPNPVLEVAVRWGEGFAGTPVIDASLAGELVALLQAPRRVDAADDRLRAAAAQTLATALDIAAEVQACYSDAQAAEEALPLIHERAALAEKLAEVARLRLEVGEGSRIDLTTLDAERLELEVETADAILAQRLARTRLTRLIGHPSDAAAWRLDRWEPPRDIGAPESEWISAALEHRPEVQSVRWELAALGDDLVAANLFAWEGASAGVETEREDGWTVGPSLSIPIPIFDTGQAQRSRLRAQQAEAKHSLTLARREVVEDVRLAYQTLQASRENLQRVRVSLVPLLQARRDQAEAIFRAEQEVVPLILAEQDLRVSQAKLIELESQTTLAMVRLERAVGGAGPAAAIADLGDQSLEHLPPESPRPVSLKPLDPNPVDVK